MKGTSLLEVLVVIAIFSMLIVLTFPFPLRLINQTKADAEAKSLSYIIFRQQQDAYSGLNNKPYGISLYGNRYIVFTGASLATADSQDTFYLNSPISMSSISLNNGSEIVFPSGSFRPQSSGYLIITDSQKSYRIDISSEGLISYYSND